MRAETAIDQKMAELRRTDPMGAAAFAMRHKSTCPSCGRYTLKVSAESAVSSMRSFICTACQWSATVTEGEYRGSPVITLRAICEESKRSSKLAARPRVTSSAYVPRPRTQVGAPPKSEPQTEAQPEREARRTPKAAPVKQTRKPVQTSTKGGDERNDYRG